jgi:hypothetical protein
VTWRYLTIGGYLLVLAAGLGLQAAAIRASARQRGPAGARSPGRSAALVPDRLSDRSGGGRGRIPRLGEVLAVIMRTRTGRVGVIVAWAWLGLHFFAK